MVENAAATQDELLAKVVQMFVEATPPVTAPIEDWRAGFEGMAANFDVPEDGEYEPVTSGSVPGLLVTAPGASDAKLVIHFHSGGYVQGSSKAYRNFAFRLSRVSGATVLVPDFRLAPEAIFPAAVDDASEVYDWALQTWGSEAIAISGDSAGGGLAMALLLKIRDEGKPQPAAGVGISPLLDLAGEGDESNVNDPLIDKNMVVSMGKVYIGEIDPHEHPYCSPLWGTHEKLPPLLVLASTTETLRDDSARFVASVKAAGGQAELSLAPGMIHIWTFFPFLEQAEKSMAEIGAFLKERLQD